MMGDVSRCARWPDNVTIVAIAKGRQRYLFVCDRAGREHVLRTAGKWAADPELSFSWYDAAIVSHKIRGEQSPDAC